MANLACRITLLLLLEVCANPVQAQPIRIVSVNLCTDALLLTLAPKQHIVAVSQYASDDQRSPFAEYCDALYLLHEGRLLASGSPDEVLTGRNLGEAFGIKAWHGVVGSHRCMVPLTAIASSSQQQGNH